VQLRILISFGDETNKLNKNVAETVFACKLSVHCHFVCHFMCVVEGFAGLIVGLV